MNHYDFNEIEVKEETEEDRIQKEKRRKHAALFIAFLMLIFLVPYDIANSFFAGTSSKENSIAINGKTIIFENDMLKTIQNYYVSHQLTEFKICLIGNITENTYRVESYYVPEILFKNPVSVHAISCDADTIIDLHSHPFRNCLFSEQDILTYQMIRKSNPQILGAVMCDIDRFSFYGV